MSWNYYKSEDDAKKCAAWASEEGDYKASLGYDFGYCCPGSIEKVMAGENAGLFMVCLP